LWFFLVKTGAKEGSTRHPAFTLKMHLQEQSYKGRERQKSGDALACASARMPGSKWGEGPGKLELRAADRPAPGGHRVNDGLENSDVAVVARSPTAPEARSRAVTTQCATARDQTFREKDGLEYNPKESV